MTHLTGSSRSSNYETYLQEQLDLARWEGEGGAPAQHVHQASAHPKPCEAAAASAAFRQLRVRELIPALN
jgi:hypothetical protein